MKKPILLYVSPGRFFQAMEINAEVISQVANRPTQIIVAAGGVLAGKHREMNEVQKPMPHHF